MYAHAACGVPLDRGTGSFCLPQMQAWGPDRTIRAEVLRCLLVGTDPIDARGVDLRGLKVLGHLDLAGVSLRCPLRLDSCYLDGPSPDFSFAVVPLLEFTRCRLAGIAAEALVVGKSLDLSQSIFTGLIELQDASIAGWLICSGGQLNGQDRQGYALTGYGLNVGDGVILDKGFTADGAIDLSGAKIAGQLNCADGHLNGVVKGGSALIADRITVGRGAHFSDGFSAAGAITIPGADITGQLNFRRARLHGRDDEGYALTAFAMTVRGDVILDKATTVTEAGAIRMFGTTVTGRFRCVDARLNGTNSEGIALVAYGMTVGSDVSLDGVVTKLGAIQLNGTEIQGALSCRGTKLERKKDEPDPPTADALTADALTVGGQVSISDFTAFGAVRLPGANIGGRLICDDAEFDGRDKYGRALLADGMKVGGGAWLGGVRTTNGAVRMVGAEVTGDLHFENVNLAGSDDEGRALVGDQIQVTGTMNIGPTESSDAEYGSVVAHTLSLKAARIGGSLQLKPVKLAEGPTSDGSQKVALDLTGAQIACDLLWLPGRPVLGQVVLEDAHVSRLIDKVADGSGGYWPSVRDGMLRLDGLTYDRLGYGGDGDAPRTDVEERLAWLGSQGKRRRGRRARGKRAHVMRPHVMRPHVMRPQGKGRVFAAQPYEQLAKVYRQSGQDTEGRKVAIARRRDLRRYGDLTIFRRAGNWLMDITVRYGYRTWRAVALLVALYLTAVGIFIWAQHADLMIPTQVYTTLHPVPRTVRCTANYPCFDPLSYAIDTVIPLVNTHQAEYWSPNAHAPRGQLLLIFTWVSTVLGWALATLVVAGYTGLVRRD
jgi:cytoskeletal protein CcmA (bactofilin family)